MLSAEWLAARRETVAESADLRALRDRLTARAAPLLERMPPIPDVKALLSRDGGVCPDDGAPLAFDPWSPDRHRCIACGKSFSGARHHAHWARAQHLWLAERAAHLATVYALTDDDTAGSRARELLRAYYERYAVLPNRDNVLGPSHLFFSTYLESIWILNYLAAACLLRATDALDDDDTAAVDAIADEAARIIGEYNEGMSNRQVWNAAALVAIGVWFGDEELIETATTERWGLLGALADGFGADGLWHEGENYHLFALRGLLTGLHWASAAGAALLDDEELARHLGQALMAPAATALPDFTFPARKDSRFGVGLNHPAYLECWEAGVAWLGDRAPADLAPWLTALYAVPAKFEQTYDSYLHEAGEPLPARRGRPDLSWWSLLMASPSLDASRPYQPPGSALLAQQGLAILRHGDQYASLECLGGGDGHGHPDRLHLTLHANGVHWLPDPGTGSYVSRDLFWYRATLAHNAPRLDGRDQPLSEAAHCLAFAGKGDWQWVVAKAGDVRRTVILGPRWLVDLTEFQGPTPRRFDLPWHLNATTTVETPGAWEPVAVTDEFVSAAAILRPAPVESLKLVAHADGHTVSLYQTGAAECLRLTAPGLPGSAHERPFWMRCAEGRETRLATAIDFHGAVTGITLTGNIISVQESEGVTTLQVTEAGLVVSGRAERMMLEGILPPPRARVVRDLPADLLARGTALWLDESPALDGSLDGFDLSSPLSLEDESQYYRSEEPYPGPEEFAATGYVNWDDAHLYVAVDVVKPEMVIRPIDAAPLLLDNEPDDIHSDGVQVYVRHHGIVQAFLVRPGPHGELAWRRSAGEPMPGSGITGRWSTTEHGYLLTFAVPLSGLVDVAHDDDLRFELLVNEMRPDRVRRAGQLAWSGGPGWVYLRGDREDVARFGFLELR